LSWPRLADADFHAATYSAIGHFGYYASHYAPPCQATLPPPPATPPFIRYSHALPSLYYAPAAAFAAASADAAFAAGCRRRCRHAAAAMPAIHYDYYWLTHY